jgi:mannitol/fructose-specific phosphotransferase system IIA component (Ntr-type)
MGRGDHLVRLSQHLKLDAILLAPEVRDRDGLFMRMAEVFRDTGLIRSPQTVVDRLIEREKILSTGIGGGVAIPHAQITGLGQLVMAASAHPDGIDYPSLDGRPVRLVFCLLGDANTAADHLAGLARLARLARKGEGLERLIQARTGDEFLQALAQLEEE